MSLTDPIGDMLARIKNSQLRNHKKVEMPSSNFKMRIADVLKNEGYINGFNVWICYRFFCGPQDF